MPKPAGNKLPKMKLNYGANGVGVTVGHRACVPRGRRRVPREMGWLWTADLPGHRFDPHWRPGAVPRSIFKLRDQSSKSPTIKSVPSRTQRGRKAPGLAGPAHSVESLPHALVVKRKGGSFQVVLQEMRNLKTRHVSEYPYGEDASPMIFEVLEESPERAARRERARARRAALHARELCRQSLRNVCREVHRKIDKNALREMAAERDECPCVFLESRIIGNLVDLYLGRDERPGSECNKERAFLDQLMKAVLEEEQNKTSGSSDEAALGSDEEWRLEFTPPGALYQPGARERTTRSVEVQTKKAEEDLPNEKKYSMSPSMMKNNLTDSSQNVQ